MEPDLDQARRRAKELLHAARARRPETLARFREPRLADAQHAVATDLGFRSWPALVHHVAAIRGDREQRRARLNIAKFALGVCPGCRGLRGVASLRCSHCGSAKPVTEDA